MNKYILGNKVIETTEERYNTTFKDLGYKPYQEPKANNEVREEIKPKRVRKSIKED